MVPEVRKTARDQPAALFIFCLHPSTVPSPVTRHRNLLAYRHLYFHAGNFADVFKHSLLTQLVLTLEKKDKPFFVCSTRYGGTAYDLTHAGRRRTRNYKDGIGCCGSAEGRTNTLVPYFRGGSRENGYARLRFYPGSPRIVRRASAERSHGADRTQQERREELEALFRGDRQVVVRLMMATRHSGFPAAQGTPRTGVHRFLFDRTQEFNA